MLLEQVGGAVEQLRPRFAAELVPFDLRGRGGADHAVDIRLARPDGLADDHRRYRTARRSAAFSPLPPPVGAAVQCLASSFFSRFSSGSRTSGSLRSTPALLTRPLPKIALGSGIAGLRLGSSVSSSATGSRTSSSTGMSSSAMRLTKLRVGAVLEQAADEIGEQFLVAADRRVDAHRRRLVADARAPAWPAPRTAPRPCRAGAGTRTASCRPAPSPRRWCWRCGWRRRDRCSRSPPAAAWRRRGRRRRSRPCG